MEEHFKTLRSLQQAVVLICAAILIFAATSDPTDKYSSALKDLNALGSLSLKQYALDQYNHFSKLAERSKELGKILGLKTTPKVTRGIYCEWPDSKATVNDYLAFFSSSDKSIVLIDTSKDTIKSTFRRALKRVRDQYHDRQPREAFGRLELCELETLTHSS